jgi:hypothetical protein
VGVVDAAGMLSVLAVSVPRIVSPRPSDPLPDGERATPGPRETTSRPSARPRSAPPGPRPTAEIAGTLPSSRSARPTAAAGTARSERAAGAAPALPKDLIRRTADALQAAPPRDGSRIRLSLRPAHLGDLWIDLSVSGSRVRGRIRTETEAARGLILAHLDDLRRELERRGLRIIRLEVDVGGTAVSERGPGAARPRSHRRQVLDVKA